MRQKTSSSGSVQHPDAKQDKTAYLPEDSLQEFDADSLEGRDSYLEAHNIMHSLHQNLLLFLFLYIGISNIALRANDATL